MNRVCWWLVGSLSELLDANERDAVRGDLAESGQSGLAALRDVCGLLLRRQAQLWSNSRPWVILVCLVIPLGMVLSILARPSSDMSAVYFWLYANNWDWALLRNRGFWYVLSGSAQEMLRLYLTLACLSWTAGFVLGRVSRRLFATNRVLFCATLLLGILGAPRYELYIRHLALTKIPALAKIGNALTPASRPASAAQVLYASMFPLIVQVCVVAIPALWAMTEAEHAARVGPTMRRIIWIGVVASMAVMFLRVPGWFVLLGASPWTWPTWQMGIIRSIALCLSVAVYWPIAYLAVKGIGERLQKSKVVLT